MKKVEEAKDFFSSSYLFMNCVQCVHNTKNRKTKKNSHRREINLKSLLNNRFSGLFHSNCVCLCEMNRNCENISLLCICNCSLLPFYQHTTHTAHTDTWHPHTETLVLEITCDAAIKSEKELKDEDDLTAQRRRKRKVKERKQEKKNKQRQKEKCITNEIVLFLWTIFHDVLDARSLLATLLHIFSCLSFYLI